MPSMRYLRKIYFIIIISTAIFATFRSFVMPLLATPARDEHTYVAFSLHFFYALFCYDAFDVIVSLFHYYYFHAWLHLPAFHCPLLMLSEIVTRYYYFPCHYADISATYFAEHVIDYCRLISSRYFTKSMPDHGTVTTSIFCHGDT